MTRKMPQYTFMFFILYLCLLHNNRETTKLHFVKFNYSANQLTRDYMTKIDSVYHAGTVLGCPDVSGTVGHDRQWD